MFHRVFAVALLMVMWAMLPAHASREINARVMLKDHRTAIDVVITGRRGDLIHARLRDAQAASMSIQARDIQHIHISLPQEAQRQAEAAFAANRMGEAVQRMRGVIQPVLPYFDLPAESLIEPAFRFGEFLRREGSWTEAIRVYKALYDNPDAAVRERANAWLAYSHARNGQFDEAATALRNHASENPQHPGFVPAALAYSLVAAARSDDETALDHAARASALSRIDHEAYPEAVFLSAEAYLRLGRRAPETATAAEVAHAFDSEAPGPALTPAQYLQAATGLYEQILRLFPTSPFAEPSSRRLADLQPQPQTNAPGATPGLGDAP
ncbi:MAG TPA: hypothetical protein PKE55_03345 [Kiritimatiellia bacterium]|nr:hypothetical protein [Kiritimatiellia bacterium]